MNLQDFMKLDSKTKLELLLNNPDAISGFDSEEIVSMVLSLDDTLEMQIADFLAKLSVDALVDFFREHKEFIAKHGIRPYFITRLYDTERQLDFVSRLEDTDLTFDEKRQILVTLKQDVKDQIKKTNFPPEYVTAIEIQFSMNYDTFYKIVPDYDKDLEIYRGLDIFICIKSGDITSENKQKLLQLYEICPKIKIDDVILNEDLEIYRNLDKLIFINPMYLSSEDKKRFLELCEICPEINIYDDTKILTSTLEEYKNTESWIESVLQGINPEWTDIQKIAYIDNEIGKKIKYSPDIDTEVYNYKDAQNVWKIVNLEIGICLGISKLEKYMLSKIGIEAEVVLSKDHAFLKLKNIELPTADGGTAKGDTILDPTWNLAAHRYGAEPKNFCRSYEEIRKNDIRKYDGKDFECHKNDKDCASATLDLDERSLREIYTSIGVADKDGNFPIKKLIDKSKIIDDFNFPAEESIKKQFLLLADYYPEFATCQEETTSILKGIILNGKNLNFNRCLVNMVYERADKEKRPVLYVYVDLPEVGRKFYFADKDTKMFVELSQEQFETTFECYEKDMEKLEGHRPWEDIEEKEILKDLNTSSGTVIADKERGE